MGADNAPTATVDHHRPRARLKHARPLKPHRTQFGSSDRTLRGMSGWSCRSVHTVGMGRYDHDAGPRVDYSLGGL